MPLSLEIYVPRRLVAPCVLIYEYMAYNRVADVGVRASVGIIVIGAIVAGWDTLNDDLFGYTLTIINNLLTAASSVMVRRCRAAAEQPNSRFGSDAAFAMFGSDVAHCLD